MYEALVASQNKNEATKAALLPLLPRYGISRVARLTGLDVSGVPVYSAVRPRATTLSVSAGKGFSETTAWISAVMESVEADAAEQFSRVALRDEPARDLSLAYDVEDLPRRMMALVTAHTPLDWTKARDLATGEWTYVPFLACGLRGVVRRARHQAAFVTSSNGVAAGFDVEAARRHALSELIERHALASWLELGKSPFRFDADRYGSAVADLIRRVKDDGLSVVTLCKEGIAGYWVAATYLTAPDMPQIFAGSAAACDVFEAVEKAVLEAFQSRTSVISGLRDDIRARDYSYRRASRPLDFERFPVLSESPVELRSELSVSEIVARISAETSMPVLEVLLSNKADSIKVVQTIAPGLLPAASVAMPN
ncbi:YcaO-like family protein [Rathayibacter tritici]|uniref:YcaO domain-containing protein n=1 Tax=Rathayibacter tritici TaxID=33888 RepID=A0A169C2S6_9MICO|nr:YcaO-like family protein [Rathayibacter tritici]AND17195.1 hypothetical protein A6122_2071 [Rathayibacter tritici]